MVFLNTENILVSEVTTGISHPPAVGLNPLGSLSFYTCLSFKTSHNAIDIRNKVVTGK